MDKPIRHKQTLRHTLCTLLLAIVSMAAYGQASVVAAIDSAAIFIGEQAHIAVRVSAVKDARVTFPVFPEKMLVPGIEVLKEEIVALNKDEESGQNTTTKLYTITSFDSALYYIPPFEVKVGEKTYQSASLALKVETVSPLDTLHLDQYFGPKENAPTPFEWSDWRPLLSASLLLVVLVLVVVYLILQIHNRRPLLNLFRIRPPLPPHQWAIGEIDKIKQATNASTELDTKAYYTQLTDVLRNYIWRRYNFNAREMTSGEIIDRLMQQNDRTMVDELRELFEVADLAKFAKLHTQIGENDANLLKAVAYVQATKDETPQAEQPKVHITPETRRTKRTSLVLKIVVGVLGVAIIGLIVYIVRALYLLFL